MAARGITRVTLFKVPKEGDQKTFLDFYGKMKSKALKDGKPYILSVEAGLPFEDKRAQGYTVSVITKFASKADFDYYDTECAAHAELKEFAKTAHEGVMMVFFENALA
ncbi:uncharacterized protein E0L32_002887 [Thyridium curvatum]|uniref:Stress-response A/B barrel domain-containing protein n=1 Tax=Thyridium curvatum TaxID=1093900 RepID=A0A507BEP1_9PEZI|nr:uncharacterized protein E0L32_002887 [Thyridium curvatum]TPX17786.1 hypothetical protein E0L32_002887 [Thyridium curvatum]